MSKLFSTYRLGNITLNRRVVMAPMTRSRAINNVPNDLMATYYGQRSGAGLIITEGTSPSPNGLGYSRIPGIFNQEQIDGWKKVTQSVHDNDGKIFVQLMHTGRISHPQNLGVGGTVLAPSAKRPENTKMWVDGEGNKEIPEPKSMGVQDIQHTIQEYIQAAVNAMEAGFDGVEVHGANGYLIKQFINPNTNQRTDEYGGSIEKRSRFLVEVIKGIADAIGNEKVGIRLSPFGTYNETPHYPDAEATYDYISKKLNDLGILYIHLADQEGGTGIPKNIRSIIRNNFKNTVIASGGYNAQSGEDVLRQGDADLIAYGRPFIANPDLVERLHKKLPLNQPKFELLYTAGEEGYTDYPVFQDQQILV